MTDEPDDARRLEALWTGEFGDAYVERNAGAYDNRKPFWDELMPRLDATRVLEVGCNVGGNLRWIADAVGPARVVGIDVNHKALSTLRARYPGINAVWGHARELPFRDDWFDLVFTMGVLIHQPEETLPQVMAELVRTSRRWVFCGEYYAAETEEVGYRGEAGALFRRDYGGAFARQHPELALREQGFLGRDAGWDDVTWWLFEKPSA